jgi:dTDP-4-dehydrorhamnose 3,5-epimerase
VIVTPTDLPEVLLVEIEPVQDERGFFARAWDEDALAAAGARAGFVQANVAYNRRGGTVRGLHYQAEPHAEAKLVRCTRGALWDVAVDVRTGSPTYLRWVAVELSAENRRALYVPEGFAHGYQTLAGDTEALYEVTARYAPEAERGLRWDDPAIGIAWPEAAERTVSAKDRAWPLLG